MTVVPIKSQTGPITSTLGKLLWAIQAWYAEMENDEWTEAVRAGQARARATGKHVGRPKAVFHRDEVARSGPRVYGGVRSPTNSGQVSDRQARL